MKKRDGTALILAIFTCMVAVITVISMLTLSYGNSTQIINDIYGKAAYYGAESGLAESINFFNTSFLNWGATLEDSNLPISSAPIELENGALYWIDNISYIDSNKIALVDIVGKYKDAYRKIRVRINTEIPKYFDDYGLLTDGVLTIRGNKTLEMSIHANDGLILSGPTTIEDGSVATQSEDPDAEAPDPEANPIGGYVEPIDVPLVPIDDLRTLTQGGIVFDISQEDINTQIANAPADSLIYISNVNNVNSSKKTIALTGDMGSKIIFVEGDIEVNAQGVSDLSNVMIVSSGILTVNGYVDFITSHPGQIDTVFAGNGNITLNGSRKFDSLFWTNGSFRQNGSSMAGRVISQDGITFNGSFTLTSSNKLFDFGTFDNVAKVSSWQQVSMD